MLNKIVVVSFFCFGLRSQHGSEVARPIVRLGELARWLSATFTCSSVQRSIRDIATKPNSLKVIWVICFDVSYFSVVAMAAWWLRKRPVFKPLCDILKHNNF